ncbi:ABC transporter substrate-binding protein [Sphingobium sp. AP49]|uniref:ABC transporter substrate-binding protein n=1 Tax=Sphingobium sp. AP49 TaxID=1144307 RepID=UPI00026EDB80|nr:ABC transporter substrate-binding protein [Sphingobium sp. AP49]WHO41078.1 ABC transporter substrate-binding protein [Sphingobium sp. AP49]
MQRCFSRGSAQAMIALGMTVLVGTGLWAAAPHGAPRDEKRPQRIVSLNLCADQLLVALADRNQIAGLTHNAGDQQMSAVAGATKGLPILDGSAEQILAVNPDLVIGMPARRNPAIAILKAQHYPAVDLKSADSYADIVASIRTVAQAIGHADRGEAMIARMDRDLAALPRAPRPKVAAYYQRRGYMTGTGTLVDDLMTRAGLRNLAADLGKPAIAQISLEEMVAARPDYLIVESATDRISDQGTEMLHHPALRSIPRISLPQAWTVCGGPAYVQAAQALSRAVSAR